VFAVDGAGRTRSSIAGPRPTFLELDTSRPFSAVGIHFKPDGASPFFGVPMSELENHTVALDLVWGKFAATVTDRLWNTDAPDEQIEILEDVLHEKTRQPRVWHSAVRHAVEIFERSRGARAVDDVAKELGLSSRRLLDIFRWEVGLSPKNVLPNQTLRCGPSGDRGYRSERLE
jgi:hypothetical protein